MREFSLITGGNTGIGFQTALQLGQMGYTIILGCRSAKYEDEAHASLMRHGCQTLRLRTQLDLSRLSSVEAFARELLTLRPCLRHLVLNAGVMPMRPQARAFTPDGLDLCFGVNHLAHMYLTLLLLPVLSPGSRVLSVTSMTHAFGGLDLSDPNLLAPGCYSHDRAYTASKLANVLFAMEFTRRHASIRSAACCPGVVATGITRGAPFLVRWGGNMVMRATGRSPEKAARECVLPALLDDDDGFGGYYEEGRRADAAPEAYRLDKAQELWELSLNIIRELGDKEMWDEEMGRGRCAERTVEDPRARLRAPGAVRRWWKVYGKVTQFVAFVLLGSSLFVYGIYFAVIKTFL